MDGCIFNIYPHGGIARMYRELLPRIAQNKRITFFVLCNENALPHLPAHPQIRPLAFHEISRSPSVVFRRVNQWRKAKFYEAVKQIAPAIFHSTYYTTPPFKITKTVATVYDLIDYQFPLFQPNGPGFADRQSRVLQLADRVMSISSATTDLAVQAFGIDRARISTIHLAAAALFSPSTDAEKTAFKVRFTRGLPFFLFVGSTSAYKNLGAVIRAYAQVAEKSGHLLVIAGHSTASIDPWYSELAVQCEVEDKIILIHHPTDEVLKVAYGASTAFVSPSLQEGFGIPLVESLQCGTRVLASDIPVFREVCADAALYFNPHRASELAGLLMNAAESELSKQAADRLCNRAHEYSWDKAAAELEKLYLELSATPT